MIILQSTFYLNISDPITIILPHTTKIRGLGEGLLCKKEHTVARERFRASKVHSTARAKCPSLLN